MNVEGHIAMGVLRLRDDTRSTKIIQGVSLNMHETYHMNTRDVATNKHSIMIFHMTVWNFSPGDQILIPYKIYNIISACPIKFKKNIM